MNTPGLIQNHNSNIPALRPTLIKKSICSRGYPQHVKVMALTATCTAKIVKIIKKRLAMTEPEIIAVQPPTNLKSLSTKLAEELKKDRASFKNCTALSKLPGMW